MRYYDNEKISYMQHSILRGIGKRMVHSGKRTVCGLLMVVNMILYMSFPASAAMTYEEGIQILEQMEFQSGRIEPGITFQNMKEGQRLLTYINTNIGHQGSAAIKGMSLPQAGNREYKLLLEIPEKWEENEKKIDTKVTEIADMAQGTDAEKAEFFKVWILDNVSYNYEAINSPKEENDVYSALFSGKTACYGYAKLFSLLCEKADISCKVVTGDVKGQYHAWNIVTVNGESYGVDLTFVDTSENVEYLYLTPDELAQRTVKEEYCNHVDDTEDDGSRIATK